MSNKRDYYETLGVSKNAAADDIKNSYRKLALQFHPDRNSSPEAEEKFKEISEAYAILSDDEKRKQYDAYGHAGIGEKYTQEDIFRDVNFNGIFRDIGFGESGNIFDVFFNRQRESSYDRQRGEDIRFDMAITLEEAASGLETDIDVTRTENCDLCHGTGANPGTKPKQCPTCQGKGRIERIRSNGFARLIQVEPCRTCAGRGTIIESPCKNCRGTGIVSRTRKIKVKIPQGVDDGSRLRLSGEGGAGIRSGPQGDLYLFIHVKPNEIFNRQEDDILCDIQLGFTQATLGTEIEVPTLEGKAKLSIPAGTQTHTVFRLKGKGIPHLNSYGGGDELVRVIVYTPTKLSSRQRELLTELAKEMGTEVKPKKRIF